MLFGTTPGFDTSDARRAQPGRRPEAPCARHFAAAMDPRLASRARTELASRGLADEV